MRPTLLLAVALALGLVAWLTLRDTTTAAPAPPPPMDSGDVVAPAEPDAPLVTASVGDVDAPVVREAAAERADDGRDVPPIPDDAKWHALTVVDAVTKAPAPDVDVWWTTEAQHAMVQALPVRERTEYWQDADKMSKRFGWHARTDADGVVRVLLGQHGTQVMASDATRFGRAHVATASKQPSTLELQRDQTLLVHVRDATGADAAGVAVDYAPDDPDDQVPPQFWGNNRRDTDADGVARFAHVQEQAVWRWGAKANEPVKTFAIQTITPGVEVEPVHVDPAALPEEPVELQLPATASLAVRVLFLGRPIPQLYYVGLHDGDVDDHQRQNAGLHRPIDDDGWAHFTHVGIGRTFQLFAHPWSRSVTGPTLPGQRLRATVDLADSVCALAGRLLDEDGEPLAETHVGTDFDLVVISGGGGVQTDADGRFLWLAGEARHGREPRIERLTFELRRENRAPLRCVVPPRDLKIGRNELGDLRLGVHPLIAGGRLVADCDERRHVQVQLMRHAPSRNGEGEGRWSGVRDVQSVVHEDMRFEVRGTVEAGRYRLDIRGYNSLPIEPVEFTVGASDLEVPVRCGASLDATCLVPDGLPPRSLTLELAPQDDAARAFAAEMEGGGRQRFGGGLSAVSQYASAMDGRARYNWPAVGRGTYTLRVRGSGDTVFATIPDVVIPPPEGGDPRLTDIDLNGSIQLIDLKITREETREATGGHRHRSVIVFVLPLPEGATAEVVGTSIWNDAGKIVAPPGPVDLMILGDETRPLTVRGVEHEATVTLQPWPQVDVYVPDAAGLPDDVQLRVGAYTRPEKEEKRRYRTPNQGGGLSSLLTPRHSSATLKDGKATVSVGDDGALLTLRLSLGRDSESLKNYSPRALTPGAPATVQLPPEELKRALEAVREAAAKRRARDG